MILKTRTHATLITAFTLAMLAFTQSAVAASGGYGSSTSMPTIYSKNFWESAAPAVVGSPPSTATITTVYYNYSYPYPRPSGFQVLLCDNAGIYCADVTSSGMSYVNFSGTGVKANTPVRFYVKVTGTGTMSPLVGGAGNVTVNYDY